MLQTNSYKARIDSLLHYINSMIQKNWVEETPDAFNEAVNLNKLAEISAMSVRNLHLEFKAHLGETVHQYIDRLRLEYAMQLLKDKRLTGTEVSEYIGFANPSAFNNIFKKKYNVTPKEKGLQLLQREKKTYPYPITYRLAELKDTPVLFVSNIGNYNTCASAIFEEENWNKLYEYALQNDLLPNQEEYWGICYDDTDITDQEKCRFYACITIKEQYVPSLDNPIKSLSITKGTYAVYLHKGSYALLDAFYDAILKQLPQAYQLGDGLILERYLNTPVDTEEESLLTEVLLPIVKVSVYK